MSHHLELKHTSQVQTLLDKTLIQKSHTYHFICFRYPIQILVQKLNSGVPVLSLVKENKITVRNPFRLRINRKCQRIIPKILQKKLRQEDSSTSTSQFIQNNHPTSFNNIKMNILLRFHLLSIQDKIKISDPRRLSQGIYQHQILIEELTHSLIITLLLLNSAKDLP